MANQLDPMDLKQIITLHKDGESNRKISVLLGISRKAVNKYVNLFKASQIPLTELLELNEVDLRDLFPSKTTIDNARHERLMTYFDTTKLSRHAPGFTLQYHHLEYQGRDPDPYSYTQFCNHYNRRYNKVKGSMKLEHKAGDKLMIDYTGKHLYITDKNTGEQTAVEVFVGILPCSQYTYVQACKSQKREDLLQCIANNLDYIGGVPQSIISDNLKSAVSRSSKYEPQINKSLKDLALHYGCVVNPTRPYRPQDKALVENAVKLVYQRIYYPLREMTFFSLKELNDQIKSLLKDYNDYLFQLKEASRKELFQSVEKTHLKPLPSTNYELKSYCRAKVQKMGYIYFSADKSYYSVPYRYIGKHTQIHYTSSTVEIYHNRDRIALHPRNPNKGCYNTVKAHLSSSHQIYKDWSPEYFKKLAKPHGESVMMLIGQLLNQAPYPELGYKSAMGIIQLHKQYGSNRLNDACSRALYGNHLSYKRVKNILERHLDKEHYDFDKLNDDKPHIPKHNNIRGAGFYN